MTPTQVVALIGLISQRWPSMKINEYTPEAWEELVEDLDFADARGALTTLAKTRPGYITAYDIRHQAAKSAGLLPPAEAEALALAVKVAGNLGEGVSALPAAVAAAYWGMGGSAGFTSPPGVLRPQWARVYAEAREKAEGELLGGDLGTAIEIARRTALEGPLP